MTERAKYQSKKTQRKSNKKKVFFSSFYQSVGGHYATEADIASMTEIMSYRRIANGRAEEEFINRFIRPVAQMEDAYGNFYVRIGEAPILWTAHTDTVHYEDGKQIVRIVDNMMMLPGKSRSSCLGADCGAGIWLMLEMIKAGVEGLYIFHRDEESGRQGSEWIASERPEYLEGIQFAIAFDRYGTNSIITHQRGSRCCSEEFAKSLSTVLELGHEADPHGSFTDTASYVGIVPECTNLSVGYYDQHTPYECQDIQYLALLRDRLISVDFRQLVCKRKPEEFGKHSNKVGGFKDVIDYMSHYREEEPDWNTAGYGEASKADYDDMIEMVTDNPRIAAQILIDVYGTTILDMADMVQDRGGTVTFYRRG